MKIGNPKLLAQEIAHFIPTNRPAMFSQVCRALANSYQYLSAVLVRIKALLSLLVLCGKLLNRGSVPLMFGSGGKGPIQGSPDVGIEKLGS